METYDKGLNVSVLLKNEGTNWTFPYSHLLSFDYKTLINDLVLFDLNAICFPTSQTPTSTAILLASLFFSSKPTEPHCVASSPFFLLAIFYRRTAYLEILIGWRWFPTTEYSISRIFLVKLEMISVVGVSQNKRTDGDANLFEQSITILIVLVFSSWGVGVGSCDAVWFWLPNIAIRCIRALSFHFHNIYTDQRFFGYGTYDSYWIMD